MQYHLARKLPVGQRNIILEVVAKSMQRPGCISFAMGSPAVDSIPVELLQQCAQEVFQENPLAVLQYGPMAGDAKLAAWVKQRVCSAKGASPDNNMVMLLTGSGKALGLVPRTLCDEGDEVYVDALTFPNAYNSALNVGARPIGIPMDEDGMLPEALEQAAKCGKGKYIYVIPNFQNPTGRTMSLARRKAIYAIARKYQLLIYEDDPYGDIRFTGEDVPSFKSMDVDNLVLYVGSFSKTLSAGLRVGYIYGPTEVMTKIMAVKTGDGQDPLFNQLIIRKCLEKMDFEKHLADIRSIYGHKARLMADTLTATCASSCRVEMPEGGMFAWVNIPAEVDIDALSEAAIVKGVAVVKSEAFAVDPTQAGHAFRLNFSAPSDEQIVQGCQLFGEVTKEFCSQ